MADGKTENWKADIEAKLMDKVRQTAKEASTKVLEAE